MLNAAAGPLTGSLGPQEDPSIHPRPGPRARGFAQDVQAEVAPGFRPFVVLFGQHGTDEADQGVAVGEDADHVGATSDLLVEPFLGLFDQIWRQICLGKR
jgi:hypothetical protein